MATSGKIIDILGKLAKGTRKQRGAERKSKRKEVDTHRAKFHKMRRKMQEAERKGEGGTS